MKRFISLFVSILLSAVALTWFAQNSINAYWQQTYHENSPLEPLSEYAWWRIELRIGNKSLRIFRRPESFTGNGRRFGFRKTLALKQQGRLKIRKTLKYPTIKRTLLLPMRLTIQIPQPASQAIRLISRQRRLY